ncbi:hypothetical protein ACH5RR_018074, partial [Cinchona calisaya]
EKLDNEEIKRVWIRVEEEAEKPDDGVAKGLKQEEQVAVRVEHGLEEEGKMELELLSSSQATCRLKLLCKEIKVFLQFIEEEAYAVGREKYDR